jgi:hypothetical protein
MVTDLKKLARELFTWTRMEYRRVPSPKADPIAIEAFQTLEPKIQHELAPPKLKHKHTPEGNVRHNPKMTRRSYQDEELVTRLIAMRTKRPLSGRVLRPKGPSEL